MGIWDLFMLNGAYNCFNVITEKVSRMTNAEFGELPNRLSENIYSKSLFPKQMLEKKGHFITTADL